MSEPISTNIAPLLLNKSRLIEQTSGGPTLHDAAARLLRKALTARFPDLPIDPDNALLVTPVWYAQGESLVSQSCRFESLTHLMSRLAFTKTTANCIEGEHFLTLSPHAAEPVHLPVGMDALTTLLNENAPVLFAGFAQSQLDYWNEIIEQKPRWQQLADTLQQALNVQSVNGWDAHECRLARLVAQHPDNTSRASTSAELSNVRARLIDLDLVFDQAESSQTRHLMLAGALVLSATLGSRELLALFTIEEGYESFSSMAQLGATLPERIDIDLRGQGLKWRLYEPDGNIFDAMVQALVSCQIDSIDALDPISRSPLAKFVSRPHEDDPHDKTHDEERIKQLDNSIPQWLLAGSLDDIQTYSGYLSALGSLRGETDSECFEYSEVPLILDYAQQQMHDAIIAEQPGADTLRLPLDDVRITLTQSFEAGGLTLPDPNNVSVQTLGEFALHNTRPYIAKVAYADGSATPDWMTEKLLSRIASEVNIGEHYPKLIKRVLIDDPVQAERHRIRYSRQLPQLLPMLALECKLKRQGDVDEHGYRLVRQLIDCIATKTPAATWPVQIRPLAFIPRFRLGKTPDTVANMFIIGPPPGVSGPCLLYRPLLNHPLRQFPCEQNMLYAFYQSGELRDSVLAWLPTPALSFEYAQYVFSSGLPSPWTITELAFEPFLHFDLTAAVDLAKKPLSDDVFSQLFTSNSQALADLADRQSTSNAERRWTLMVDSGWAIFGVAGNFLGGPRGTDEKNWQTISQIQQALDAHDSGNTAVEWSSIGDVLLALGILLAQKAAVRRIRLSGPLDESPRLNRPHPGETPQVAAIPGKTPTVTQDTLPSGAGLPEGHLSLLAHAAPLRSDKHASFTQLLERLTVPRPALSEGARANAAHLYEAAGKQYAQVGVRWFQVRAEGDEQIMVVDPENAGHRGLCIRFDAKADLWNWDLRLRLRGGGPTGRIEALRRERAARKEEAWAALHRFIEQEARRKASLDEALQPLENNDPTAPMSEAAVVTYITKADELASAYTQALQDLEKWREAGGAGVFYQSQLMRFSVEQHRYLSGWMRMKLREYARIVEPQLSTSEPAEARARAIQMQAARQAIAVSDAMVERLAQLHASLDRLDQHTGATRKVANDLRRLMPSFTRRDLHANEIGMSIEISLRDAPDSILDPLRQLIVPVFEGAAEAGHLLVERRIGRALDVEQLSAVTDRLADAERRLQEVFASSSAQLETIRFQRVQQLIADFHLLARERLLKVLPEPEEVAVTAMARLDMTPSTSRGIGKVSKSRPRIIETQPALPADPAQTQEHMPVIRTAIKRPVPAPALDDVQMIDSAMTLVADLEISIKRLRTDAHRPSRIPADMQDLFDQQAARFDQAAVNIEAIFARRSAEFPIGTLSTDLREAARRLRREGISVYGSMLTARKPRESYLKWLHDHDLVQIVKDPRGRIRTKQRKDFFQEYRILDKARDNKALWVAHFHYDSLTDPSDRFTAAHLKFADGFVQELPVKTRQELDSFDAVDNVLRRITSPAVRDLFLHPRNKRNDEG